MKYQSKKWGLGSVLFLAGTSGVIALNLLAWLRVDFCDWYVINVFPLWLHTYARLTSLVPFSVGEIMLVLAVVITAFGISFFIWNLIRRFRYQKQVKRFFQVYAWIVLIVLYIMTSNCFIMYHTTEFTEKYLVKGQTGDMVVDASDRAVVEVETEQKNVYTKKNLAILRDYLVEQCNEMAPTFERDAEGTIIYEDDLIEKSVEAMQKMGETYPQLSGFYVTPKYLSASEFFSQQYIMGYYFPFSLEANINSMMYITNVAPTVCHELAHTKGFIYEDDANMIGYLACIQSEDEFLQYCGYLSVLNYVNNDFYDSIGKNKNTYKKHVRISDLVADDNVFLTKEDWEVVEKKAVVKTETVKKVSNTLMEATLKLNGVEEGMQQYNQVVNLLLEYYDGILY